MKFIKKPIAIEATQWFKNGDHPDDRCYPLPLTEPDEHCPQPYLSEGKVVNYFHAPKGKETTPCPQCNKPYSNHGWIETFEGGHIVCPGDWIITGVMGEKYPCKPDIFEKTYEKETSNDLCNLQGGVEVRDCVSKRRY